MLELDGLEPGPLSLGPLPFEPRVSDRVTFAGLAELIAPTLTSGDDVLGASGTDVTENVPADIDAAFASTVDVAIDAHAAHAASLEPTTTSPMVENGQAADNLRQSVLSYLPQPSAPIELPFQEPPAPPRDGTLHEPAYPGPDRPPGPDGSPGGGGEGAPGGGGGEQGGAGPTPGAADGLRAAIAGLYRELLGREPDESGMANWMYEVAVNGHSMDWVREQFIASAEYQNSHDGGSGGGGTETPA